MRSSSAHATPCLAASPAIDEPKIIGEAVFAAVCAVARALDERQQGTLRPVTKALGGDLIAALYTLRRDCAADIDFDAVARTAGKQVLRTRYGELKRMLRQPYAELSDAVLDEMVSWPLDILAKVVQLRLN